MLSLEDFNARFPKRNFKEGATKAELYEELLEVGYTKSEVARKFNTTVDTVNRALQRKRQKTNSEP